MFCTACGRKNSAESNYCKQCGLRLEKIEPTKISEEAFDRALPPEEQVSALLERAYRLRKEGNIAAAIERCEEALQLRPESTSAHSLLGQLYELEGKREQAIRAYERVLLLNPGSIADRVKLDELRAGTDLPAPRRDSTPHIVLAERPAPPGNSTRHWATLALSGGALLLLGGVLALQLRSQPKETLRSVNNPAPNYGAQSPTPISSGRNNSDPVNKTSGSSLANPPASNPSVGEKHLVATNSSVPNGVSSEHYVYYPSQPTKIIYVPTLPANPASKAAAPAHSAEQTAKKPEKASPKGRVRLPDDSDVTENDGQYTIRIHDLKHGEPTGKTGGEHKDAIVVGPKGNDPKAGGANDDATYAPSGDALSMIAAGNAAKQKTDYNGAIKWYRKALPTAGDSTGSIYQNIAICFAEKGDRASAKTYYQNAIGELKKLETAGRLTETGKIMIRACEQGVKTCSE